MIMDLILKHINPYISNLWDSLILWRSLSLFLIVLISLTITFKTKLLQWLNKEKQIEHDKNVYERINSTMNETAFDAFLTCVETNNMYRSGQIDILIVLENRSNKNDYCFLNKKLLTVKNELVDSIKDFTNFITTNYFASNQVNDFKYYLQPELDSNRCRIFNTANPTKFDEYVKEQSKKINILRNKYEMYLKTCKKILYVWL